MATEKNLLDYLFVDRPERVRLSYHATGAHARRSPVNKVRGKLPLWQMLLRLNECGTTSALKLATTHKLDQGTVQRHLKLLCHSGFATRQADDLFQITARGKRVLKAG